MKKCGFAQNHNTGKYKQICSYLLLTNLENLILHAVATAHELWKYSFQEVFYHGAVLKSVKFRSWLRGNFTKQKLSKMAILSFLFPLSNLQFLKKKEMVMKKRNQTTSIKSPLSEDKYYSILIRKQIQNFDEYLPEMNKK